MTQGRRTYDQWLRENQDLFLWSALAPLYSQQMRMKSCKEPFRLELVRHQKYGLGNTYLAPVRWIRH